jgi:uncharacterized damage-inducible protein DinB
MESALARIFEHNHWANLRLLEACAALGPEDLDARPDPAGWSLRDALAHLVESERGYLELLTGTRGPSPAAPPSLGDLRASAAASGEGLVALARRADALRLEDRIRTSDGYVVAPWVVLVQAVNHANDHRRQVAGMLRGRGVVPPRLDGWGFGEAVAAVVPLSE